MMEWIAALGGIATSAASGGIFGLIGTGITSLLNWAQKKQEIAREIALRELDLQEVRLNGEMAMQQAEAAMELEGVKGANALAVTEAEADGEARVASYENDKATYHKGRPGKVGKFLLVLVDVLRGIMRPAITIAAIWMLWEIGSTLQAMTGGDIPKDQASAMWMQIIQAIVLLATTTTTWWFGTRPIRGK